MAWLAVAICAVFAALAGCTLAGGAGRLAAVAGLVPAAAPAGPALVVGEAERLAPGAVPPGKGQVELGVRWPARAAQVIPDSTDRVAFDVIRAGTLVASTSVARPAGGGTATSSLELDAGSYRLDAAAKTGVAGTVVATASATLTVIGGARVSAALTLGAAYSPAITALSQTSGLVGESVIVTGSNLVLSWAGTPSVRFTGTTASVSATVAAIGTDSITVTIPAGAVSGPVQVSVDGVVAAKVDFGVVAGNPQLFALQSPIASAGDTIYLEGIFGSAAVVNFPGGVTANATVLGRNRASVVVPASATNGALTVSTAGATTTGRPFRAASFTPGLGKAFRKRYEQTDSGRQMPSMAQPRAFACTAQIGRYVYSVAGDAGGGRLGTVDRAAFDAAGNLGPFATVSGVDLAVPRENLGCAVVGSYFYVFGGYGLSTHPGSVERAPIDAAGNLSDFETVPGVTLVTPRESFGWAVIGRHLYLFGGYGNTSLNTVERAPIDASGNLGTFATWQNAMNGDRWRFGLAVLGNYVYAIGGKIGGVLVGTVERAAIDGEGNVGAFQAVGGINLVAARQNHGTAVVGSAVYVFGGEGGSTLDTVECAPVTAGTLGTFATVSGLTLTTARYSFGTAIGGNHLYVFGGQGASGRQYGVERVAIAPAGSLGDFAAAPGSVLTRGRKEFGRALVGKYYYVYGGDGGGGVGPIGDVERAEIDAAGNMGSFSVVSGVTLPGNLKYVGSALVGGKLFTMGGHSGGSSSGVWQSAVDLDGNFPSPSNVSGVDLVTGRHSFGIAVIGNYVYVFGGYGTVGCCQSALDSVERATLDGSGNIGDFAAYGTSVLTQARSGICSAVIGNYVYALGGGYGGVVDRAAIDASGNLATFASAGVSLASDRIRPECAVVGDYLYVFGGWVGGARAASVERAAVSAAGDLGAFSVVGQLLGTGRGAFGHALIGNWLYAVGGGEDGAFVTTSVERAALP